MLPTLLFSLAISFIMTTMLAQLFPDGRFPFPTLLLVMLAGAAGAWFGNLYLGSSILTGGLLGAGLTSSLLLFLLHRLGILVAEPWPVEKKQDAPEEREE
jgi:hypothetical protein